MPRGPAEEGSWARLKFAQFQDWDARLNSQLNSAICCCVTLDTLLALSELQLPGAGHGHSVMHESAHAWLGSKIQTGPLLSHSPQKESQARSGCEFLGRPSLAGPCQDHPSPAATSAATRVEGGGCLAHLQQDMAGFHFLCENSAVCWWLPLHSVMPYW